MNTTRFAVLCTIFMVALATSLVYAGASCCDPENKSAQNSLSLTGPQTGKSAAPAVHPGSTSLQPRRAVVTSMGSGWNVPQNQALFGPSWPVKAPAAPSCCAGANNRGAQQVNPQAGGCACCAAGSGCQAKQSGVTQGPVRLPAGPYPLPATLRNPYPQHPVANGAAYRQASSGALW